MSFNTLRNLDESFRRKPGWRFTACFEFRNDLSFCTSAVYLHLDLLRDHLNSFLRLSVGIRAALWIVSLGFSFLSTLAWCSLCCSPQGSPPLHPALPQALPVSHFSVGGSVVSHLIGFAHSLGDILSSAEGFPALAVHIYIFPVFLFPLQRWRYTVLVFPVRPRHFTMAQSALHSLVLRGQT